MSQTPIDFSGDPTGDELLDDLLSPMQHNFLSGHSGTSRPAYAEEGTEWLDKTSNPWIVKRFDGSDDIITGYINPTTNIFTPAGLILDKLDATTAPTINDDNADGYGVGSKWIDVTNDRAYIAVDVSTGAAVWKEISGSLNGPGVSIDSEVVLFSGTAGRTVKRATGTGYVKVTSGVMGTPATTVPLTDLANQAANSVVSNATNASAPPTAAITLAASQLFGRGSTGNLAAITIGTSMTLSGTTLDANLPADGSASVKGIVKVDGTTITASGGVISAPYQLNTFGGIGTTVLASDAFSGGSSTGSTQAGIHLTPFPGGTMPGGGAGTWQASSAHTSGGTNHTLYQRIA